MEYIASGAQADIYKDGSKAIKLFKYNISKYDIEREFNLQKMAYNYGLPVPKIYDIIEKDNKLGIIMEYVEGIPVGNIIFNNNTKFEEYIKISIEIQNNIHKIETNEFPFMKEKLKLNIVKANILYESEKENLLLKLEDKIFENKLCHGDFHILNLIQTSNGIKIIDWICGSSGSPDADIYRTYLLYKLYDKEISEIYLKTYCKMYNLDKFNILKWASIVAGARIGEYIKDEKEKNILMEIINESK